MSSCHLDDIAPMTALQTRQLLFILMPAYVRPQLNFTRYMGSPMACYDPYLTVLECIYTWETYKICIYYDKSVGS